MDILFAGTGEIGIPSFEALLTSDHRVVGLVTQPDKPVGRKQILTPPAIKTIAERHGLPVFQPARLRNAEAVERIRAFDAEVIVVMAYGQILPKAVLDAPAIACINLHASILPKYRGAAPIQAAIREGETETGITVMYMDVGLDTGDILLVETLPIAAAETGETLHDRLAELAPVALLKALGQLAAGTAPRIPQDDDAATEVRKLERHDGQIDWTRPGQSIERLIRAYHPWPGAFTSLDGGVLKIFPPAQLEPSPDASAPPGQIIGVRKDSLLVQTGDAQALAIGEIQQAGRKRLPVQAFLAGHPVEPGVKLG